MKQTFTLLSFFLVFLFTNCAPKETFLFSNIPAGQGVQQKSWPEVKATPVAPTLPSANIPEKEQSLSDSMILTASTVPLQTPFAAAFHKKVLPNTFKTTVPAKTPVTKVKVSPVRILKMQKNIRKQLKLQPAYGVKPVNKLAKVAFILGLGAIGLLLLAAIGQATAIASVFSLLALFASIGSLITGIIGLKEINKNPDQYAGKGKALTGIIIGGGVLLIYLVSILLILALISAL